MISNVGFNHREDKDHQNRDAYADDNFPASKDNPNDGTHRKGTGVVKPLIEPLVLSMALVPKNPTPKINYGTIR